ncbi:putative MULE transposase domain, FHY3/FAR1 family [Helianthus annuus]|uniref:MULE transposase domain, FHY3/FAR1 family n=1 Tax=Helianthus annuus TaxID=4232 RepID=A0A9K3GUC6_HELAN|nr:putative MULE transposase domain, FHY3/FAR1 family [Helianthus annuus]
MSSFWKDNYFGNRYSNDTWGSNAANEEEEVVSGVPVNQETQLPDLNKTPTPPVDEPNYPAHQVCPDYGYGYESPYVQQSGYGVENAPVDEPYYPSQQSYPGYGVYGDEGGYGSYSGYGGDGGYGGEGGYSVYDRSRDEVGYGGYEEHGGYGYESRNTSLYEPSTPGNPFQVNERFMSLTDLKNWVQETGKDNGYVIVTRRSKNIGGTTGMVWLVCDRSGEHRSKATVRKAGSKKIGCPFSLLAIRDVMNDTWELKVDCANHNHEPTTSLLGHAFVRRFTKAEYKLLEQLTAQNMEPRIIFQTLRKQFPDSLHVQKDVQNAVQKIRATIMDGKNPIQALESLLHDRRFIYDTRQDPKTDVVTEIFFVHPYSITMWRAFPHVMLIDATYKTNLYNMPFVQVVGMTSTGKSFCIAHAVICKERRGNYVWVLERIKSILHECMMPRVIVTDRELALINACSKVFPNAKRLLCHFHIQQNIARKCKSGFDKEDWGKFMSYWRTLCESSSEAMYKYNLEKMYNRLVVANRESVYDYVYENWLKDYKDMFVYAWTDKCRNFGQRTTNRVESQHANLKRYITRGSSLERIARCIIDIVETQYDEIQKSFTESIEKTMNHHRHRMLDNLRGKVSHEALDLLEKELLRKMDVLRKLIASCGCHMWLSKGLPCACRLENYTRTGRIIQLDEIDVFWRKLDLLPCKLVDEEVDIVAELNNVRQHLEAQSPVQQKSMLSKIKAVFTPKSSTKKPPIVQQNTRGRPTSKKVQERLDEAARLDQAARYSSCGEDSNVITASPKHRYDLPRHSSYVPSEGSRGTGSFVKSEKPKMQPNSSTSSKKKETRDDKVFPLIKGDEHLLCIKRFKNQIPSEFRSYISRIQDVTPDGHCGYRSVAVGLGFTEHAWPNIRRDLLLEIDHNKPRWKHVFETYNEGDFKRIRKSIEWHSVKGCDQSHWMEMSQVGLLIAQRYNIVLHVLSIEWSSTIFPLTDAPLDPRPQAITLIHVHGGHFIHAKLEGDYPMPLVNPMWSAHRSIAAKRWEEMYTPRLEHYYELMHPKSDRDKDREPSLNVIED